MPRLFMARVTLCQIHGIRVSYSVCHARFLLTCPAQGRTAYYRRMQDGWAGEKETKKCVSREKSTPCCSKTWRLGLRRTFPSTFPCTPHAGRPPFLSPRPPSPAPATSLHEKSPPTKRARLMMDVVITRRLSRPSSITPPWPQAHTSEQPIRNNKNKTTMTKGNFRSRSTPITG